MPETSRAAMLFLINTLFDLFLFILVVRILLVLARASYFDPIVQLVTRLSNFIIVPLRKIIPNIRRIELASILLLIFLDILKFALIAILSTGHLDIIGLIILAFADCLKLFIEVLFFSIILQALLSWLQPQSPVNRILYQVTAPIMQPIRAMLPPISGFDLAPIPALIILQLLIIVLINPLMAIGLGMVFA